MTTIQHGQTGLTLPTDFNAKVFDSNEVVLFDLFRESLRAGSAMVEGRTFINCRLDGPAVMAAVAGCEFDSTDFGYASGDIRTMVIRSAAPGRMIGALPFKDCKFIGCMFFAVGFTGPETFLHQILALETRA
jgi:hypothetical protein